MNKGWRLGISLVALFISYGAVAQVGGNANFGILALPTNAKLAALGGVTTSHGTEVFMVASNPALLQPAMHQQVAFSFTDYLADISQNSLQYATKFKQKGMWGLGLSYLTHGKFTQRDAAGNPEGEFTANAYTVSLTHSSTLNYFTLGATTKMAVAGIAEYKAAMLLADLGGIFKHPEKDLTVGLVLKNIGYQVKSFTQTGRELAPFTVQLGFTYKPEHMPLRFSVTAYHLQNFNLTYSDTTGVNQGINPGKKSVADEIARHLVVGGEFLLSKNLVVRAGYNHLRRRELRLDNAGGAAGFSVGAMLRIKAFQLDYARSAYHPAGATNYFTLTTSFKDIFKNKKDKKGRA